jgi:hypothetical protein
VYAFLRHCVPKAQMFQLNLALLRGFRANRTGRLV